MRPVTTEFASTLRGSHLIDADVELLFPGASTWLTVAALEGRVTIDRTSQVRRMGSVTIPWTVAAKDLLGGIDIRTLPLGGYARPRRGILYPDGRREVVSLGVLRVESVTWSEVEQRATLELADRMAQVRDEPFQVPYDASGKRAAAAARELVEAVFGPLGIDYHVNYDPPTIIADTIYSDSRIDAVFELARSAGADVYFDADGDFVFDVAAGGQAVELTGTLTDGSAIVTGLATTTQLAVGMTVIGIGVPAFRRIASIDSLTQVTLNAPVNLAGVKNSRTAVGSNVVTEITDTDDLSVGMSVAGVGIPAGTTITAIRPAELTLSRAATLAGYPLLTYTAPNPAALTFAGSSIAYPVWEIDAGENGVLVDTGESLHRTSVYNGILVTGQATAVTGAFAVLVVDSEPTSPTRWGGPFGHVLRVESSVAIQNADQATVVGQVLLNEGLGLTRSLTITAAPNPALEAGDIVRVVFGDGRDELHQADVVEIALGTEAIRLATRSTSKPSDPTRWAPLAERRVFTGEDVWHELRRASVAERVRQRSRA